MNKTAACIKLIQILSSRSDYISTTELADILEINKRNIREYIKEIEIAGYTVNSIKGVYGGYKLDKTSILPSIKLTGSEKEILQSATEYLANKSDYLEFDKYRDAMGKVLASFEAKNEISPVTMIDRFPLAIDKNILQYRYNILSNAIDEQLKCKIKYISSSNQEKEHVIHPYKLFVYNASWFVLAFNETVSDFGYFKINRMEQIEKTKNHFSKMLSYNESDYLDEFGMKQNGEYYNVVLELEDLKTAITERKYGKNQIVEEIDENHIRFSCDMQNKKMILSFVLSFGSKCKVISPDWLVDDVKEEYWKALSMYE